MQCHESRAQKHIRHRKSTYNSLNPLWLGCSLDNIESVAYCRNHCNAYVYCVRNTRSGLHKEWEHISLKNRIAHLPETKNGSKRDIPLSIKARDALIRLGVKTKGPVFSYRAAGLKSSWRYMLESLGIEDLHFHDLRHEAVSRLMELGTLDLMEVAAISGHRSLQMLKRYTHLKAQKLVRKLEGNRNKAHRAVIEQMVPYPASCEDKENQIVVRLLDFDGVAVQAETREAAIMQAQDALLRHLMTCIRDSSPIPQPDQYLETIPEQRLVMIDPLAACSV